jgi:hypothetical protein
MGGDLPPPTPGAVGAPAFAVSALRDPGTAADPGTQLQRVQIVKGWLEGDEPAERVYEVDGSPDNGARVDPASCATAGSGHDSLCSVWRDPDFDPAQPAFYYARAVENPTCRWSQKLCVARGVRCDALDTIASGLEACCAPEAVAVIQERAWSSPIWYTPGATSGAD